MIFHHVFMFMAIDIHPILLFSIFPPQFSQPTMCSALRDCLLVNARVNKPGLYLWAQNNINQCCCINANIFSLLPQGKSNILGHSFIHQCCYDSIGLHLSHSYIGLLCFLSLLSLHQSPCTIQSVDLYTIRWDLMSAPLYDTVLCLISCMISISEPLLLQCLVLGGVTIPIDLVSSTTDSIRRSIVLFKPVLVWTSDPKSEFLCQLSLCCAEPADSPRITSYAWDISHTLITTYHPYCHSPSALTKYLKQKLHHQQAKRLGHSLPAQVEQNIPLKCNKCCCMFPTHVVMGQLPSVNEGQHPLLDCSCMCFTLSPSLCSDYQGLCPVVSQVLIQEQVQEY